MNTGPFTSYGCAGDAGYKGGQNTAGNFPRPYLDYTSTAVPSSFSELIDWSEYIFLFSDVRELFRRQFAYFITDIDVTALDAGRQPLSDSDTKSWTRHLTHDMQWPVHAMNMLDNVATYGNDFLSVVPPIQRYLRCPSCGLLVSLKEMTKDGSSEFKYEKAKFIAKCASPHCSMGAGRRGQAIPMRPVDMRVKDPDSFKIVHWPIREMVIFHYSWTDENHFYWRIPESYKRVVRKGDPHTLATADIGVLEAIENDKMFKFSDGRIFHAKEPVISGLQTRGWGIPRTLYLARQAWTLQLVRKNIQALGIDFITPIRLISPANVNMQAGDGFAVNPNTMMNRRDFDRIFDRIRSAHRRDPTKMHSISVPIDYKLVGGEANQLFPVDLHQQAKEDLLDAGGFPVELYKGSLTIQAAPVGLRLFEAQNRSIPMMLNHALGFIAERITELASRDPVEAKHQRVTMVDDIEKPLTKLQLAQGGQTSLTSALRTLGMDFETEVNQIGKEQEMLTEMQMKQQDKQMNQDAVMQAMPMPSVAGGAGQVDPATGQPMPAGGGGGGEAPVDPYAGMLPSTGFQPPQDVQGMQAAAVSLAQTMLQLPPAQRNQEYQILRQTNEMFHSLVRAEIDKLLQSVGSEARAQVSGAAPPPM